MPDPKTLKQMRSRKPKSPYKGAKTILARWLDQTGAETSYRGKVLQAFDRLRDELPNRDSWFEVTRVALDGTEGLRAHVVRPRVRVGAWRGGLFVATVNPGWGVGWRKLFKDGDVSDLLSWLIHYVRQYIHRSLTVGALMALWEEHGLLLHPFGSVSQTQRWGSARPIIPHAEALANAARVAETTWHPPDAEGGVPPGAYTAAPDLPRKHLEVSSPWLDRNTLDPHIHQGAFHILRGTELMRAGFGMEAVVAFDCVLEVAGQFLQTRDLTASPRGRTTSASFFGVHDDLKEAAHTLGLMRNHFGAHAGGWRWWDFHEMFEDALEDAAALAGEVLRGMADLEPQHRVVESTPQRWSEWFWAHFETLWRAVWFEPLATWQPKDGERLTKEEKGTSIKF